MHRLPQSLAQSLPPNLIVFDGECVLCAGFFRFMLKHDRAKRFSYATAQSPLGQQLYQALGLPLKNFETNLVIVNGDLSEQRERPARRKGGCGSSHQGLG